jgi:uncharacterized phage infection (PIP) family protein YhgE
VVAVVKGSYGMTKRGTKDSCGMTKNYHFASRLNLFASGLNLFASGLNLFASSLNLFASGLNLFASGLNLFASGLNLFASGLNLFASGLNSKKCQKHHSFVGLAFFRLVTGLPPLFRLI